MPETRWAASFPRLFELYLASNTQAPSNWFLQNGVIDALQRNDATARDIERELEELDDGAWDALKAKAKHYVHKTDEYGYHKQLFECLNEAKGYLYLKREGYKEIKFLEARLGQGTPDLSGWRLGRLAAVEVKTVNESVGQKKYFETPRETREMVEAEYTVPEGLKAEILRAIESARSQLVGYDAIEIGRRIIYLVFRPDFNFHGDDELLAFIRSQGGSGCEIFLHIL